MKKFEIKITGSGTQEEIVEALRNVANNILSAGAGNPEGLNDELDDTEWEDSTLVTKVDIEEKEPTYILSEDGIMIVGSHGITLNEKIRNEELHEYYIEEKEEIINNLIMWISECSLDRRADKTLMQDDLKMLMDRDDTYFFSSNSTNSYIFPDDSGFDETCKELIELNETL